MTIEVCHYFDSKEEVDSFRSIMCANGCNKCFYLGVCLRDEPSWCVADIVAHTPESLSEECGLRGIL